MSFDEKMLDRLTKEIRSKTSTNLLNCGVMHIKMDTTIVDINKHALEIFGLPKNKVLYKKVLDVFRSYTGAAEENAFRRNFEKRKKGIATQYELLYTDPKGQKKNILVNATPVKGTKNKVIGSLALILDITDRTKAQYVRYSAKVKNTMKELKEQRIRSKALFEGQEITKSILSKEIHDGLGQILTAIKLNLQQIEIDENLSSGNKKRLSKVRKMIKDSIVESRRISHFLSPAELNAYGLEATVSTLINSLAHPGLIKFCFYSNLGAVRFTKEIETNIYRITQEILLNIIQHSRAKNVSVKMSYKLNIFKLSVNDDGIGFDFNKKQPKGIGILNIIERCKIIKAKLEINTGAGKGTEIEVTLQKKMK